MDISNIISVTASLATPGVSRIGFGEPAVLFYGPNTVPSGNPITDLELVRRYSLATALADMVTDGFAATDPVYYAVQAIAAQSPAPSNVKLIRGGTAFTHAVELTPALFTTGATIAVTLTKGATSRPYSITAGGVSLNAEATALAAAMNADASGWGSGGTAELTIAVSGAGAGDIVEIDAITPANDGEIWYYSARTNLDIEDVTTDRGMATDLNAAVALDADWYGLVLADAFGALEIAAAAGWAAGQTNKQLFAATQDTEVPSAGTGIGATLSGLNRTRTALTHSKHSMSQSPGGCFAGRYLPADPDKIIMSNKGLSNLTPSAYTAAEITNLSASYVNFYSGVETGGVEIVQGNLWKGWSSGSSESFIDTDRLIDALVFEIQSRLLGDLRMKDKPLYTDAGISDVKKLILAAIKVFQPQGFETGSEFCNIPLKSSISAADIAARNLPDVVFGTTLSGGIAKVVITGQLSV